MQFSRVLLTLATAAFCLPAAGQITLTAANNTPTNGLTVRSQIGTYLPPGPSGVNQVWNFSGATFAANDSFAHTYYDCPTLGTCSQFPGATLAQVTIQTVQGGVKDTAYFTTASSGYQQIGSQSSRRNLYANPRTVLQFPLTFGNAFTDSFRYNQYNGSILLYTEIGFDTLTVDGWGKLVLPDGTVYPNVLRYKTSTTRYADFPAQLNQETYYTWFGPNSITPILQSATAITTSSTGQTTYSGSLLNRQAIAASVTTPTATDGLTLSPNPTTHRVTINSQDAGTLQIMDVGGRVLMQQSVTGNGALALDISDWPRGFYMLQLRTALGVSTEKLIMQ